MRNQLIDGRGKRQDRRSAKRQADQNITQVARQESSQTIFGNKRRLRFLKTGLDCRISCRRRRLIITIRLNNADRSVSVRSVECLTFWFDRNIPAEAGLDAILAFEIILPFSESYPRASTRLCSSGVRIFSQVALISGVLLTCRAILGLRPLDVHADSQLPFANLASRVDRN